MVFLELISKRFLKGERREGRHQENRNKPFSDDLFSFEPLSCGLFHNSFPIPDTGGCLKRKSSLQLPEKIIVHCFLPNLVFITRLSPVVLTFSPTSSCFIDGLLSGQIPPSVLDSKLVSFTLIDLSGEEFRDEILL
ncbi:hypothetical protein TNIN_476611 [Trichonephila inaurata madagascariensis]|uniref:Uncharacterized protein n=1 Tax=Trichonephila inaurata madagascariensis TaxID=2747483 RepID=A0A8X6XSS0_9ARAC|nr:hypothetical protein TNIN_476611 [Trichonephila inaurata madagascariensis]